MKTVVQRVASARVDVDGETVGAIDRGLLAYVGVERDDSEADAYEKAAACTPLDAMEALDAAYARAQLE